ncbi:MAG: D-glycerate dehydrogenase [Actinobacteria bacterium]|jgi:glyoxylate reductase|nr:D-glycerate dehydrogenase [Actinomycetota bacterium]
MNVSRSDKPRLLLTRRIPEPGYSLAHEVFTVTGGDEDRPLAREFLLQGISGVDALICLLTETVDGPVMDAAGGRLRVISNMAVGFDNIDVAAATARGILVTNTPGVLTDATADLAWALILGAARRVVEGDRLVREGLFEQWGPFLLLGRAVAGATLGIVGMGRIGQAVARRAVGFDMRVLYTRLHGPLSADEIPAGARWEYCPGLDELLSEADVVSLHVPLDSRTRHLIGARELGLMKPGSLLVNTSRGPVVDEAALVDALKAGRPGGAGLDVYEEEPRLAPGLAGLENVVLLPHLGSATVETRGRMAVMAVENASAAVRGEAAPHVVNPEALSRMMST